MTDIDAFSVDEFCYRHNICRATFYNLLKDGRGPTIMKVGSRTLISQESAAAWRRKCEAQSPSECVPGTTIATWEDTPDSAFGAATGAGTPLRTRIATD
jgi:predicted DNA-binding transcriptional regulator AlpA